MALFDRNDYDRGYRGNWGQGRARGEREGMGAWNRGYDRDLNRGWGANRYRADVDRTPTGYAGAGTYDRDYDRVPYGMGYTYREGTRWGAYDRNYGYGAAGMTGYDHGYGAAGYDRNYKSRMETDAGDPFGDRAAHTPIRMINGEYGRGMYDRDYGNRYNTMGYGYDREYNQGLTDEPYYRGGAYRGYDRGFTRDRDRGWF